MESYAPRGHLGAHGDQAERCEQLRSAGRPYNNSSGFNKVYVWFKNPKDKLLLPSMLRKYAASFATVTNEYDYSRKMKIMNLHDNFQF